MVTPGFLVWKAATQVSWAVAIAEEPLAERVPDRLAPDSVEPPGAAPPSLAAQEDRASAAAVTSARTAPLREIFTRSPCQTLTQSGEHWEPRWLRSGR